jgi:hypothetical protein
VPILVGTNSDLGSHAIDEELPAHSELSKKRVLNFASRVNYKTYDANRINSEHDLLPDPQATRPDYQRDGKIWRMLPSPWSVLSSIFANLVK